MPNREQLLRKIANMLSESKEFKDFHGKIEFQMSFGEAKHFTMTETFVKNKKKKFEI